MIARTPISPGTGAASATGCISCSCCSRAGSATSASPPLLQRQLLRSAARRSHGVARTGSCSAAARAVSRARQRDASAIRNHARDPGHADAQ